MAVLSLTRNGNPVAQVVLGAEVQVGDEAQGATVNELQPCGFQVDDREADTEYRLRIGDRDPGTADGEGARSTGLGRGRAVHWDDALYFDGARGRVWVHLDSRLIGSGAAWTPRARLPVYVSATKLSQQRYDTMLNQLRRLAAGLLFDLVSPMLRSLRFGVAEGGISSRSSQLELRLLERLWRPVAQALREIAQEPVTRIDRRWETRMSWGGDRFGARTIARLAAAGLDPRRRGAPRPFRAERERFAESTDTIEHRVIAGLLIFLRQRVEACSRDVGAHIRGIEADRALRERGPGDAASLYEQEDAPRVRALRTARGRARRLRRRIIQAEALQPLRGLVPRFALPATPVFEHVRPYRRIRDELNAYLRSSLILLEDGFDERLKSTQRMYEQWVFFQVAAALQHAGLQCASQDGLFQRSRRFRFTLDVDRGARLTFGTADGRAVVLRFEPWVLPFAGAQQRRDTVYRGTKGETSWSPDVLLEVLGKAQAEGAAPEVEYAVAIDAKYTRRIQEHHWMDTLKYQDIRATRTRRQIVKQLWLAYPNEEESIEPEDSAVTWSERGPDCSPDDFICGRLGLIPPTQEAAGAAEPGWIGKPEATITRFIGGLLTFLSLPHGSAPSRPEA